MLLAIVVGIVAGAITGGIVNTFLENGIWLAIIAGLVGVGVADIARHLVVRAMPAGPRKTIDDMTLPVSIRLLALVAGAVGGLAGHLVALQTGDDPSAWVTGALAGLVGAILMAILMLTYLTAVQRAKGV
jgi:uncharacterized membrane protein YeaQ/YmgE (transglycosylase-associated protein family)